MWYQERDPAEFVQVLDERTLVIPDRPGNRRADTFKNILQNDRVGLFFLIPGKHETLRVSGRAMIVRDLGLREQMAVGGKIPDFTIMMRRFYSPLEVQQMRPGGRGSGSRDDDDVNWRTV